MAASGFLQNSPHFNLPSGILGFKNNDFYIFALPSGYLGYLQNPSGFDVESVSFSSGVKSVGGGMLAKAPSSASGAIGGFLSSYSEIYPSGKAVIGGITKVVCGTSVESVGGAVLSTISGSGSTTIGGGVYSTATAHEPAGFGGFVRVDSPFDYKIFGGYLFSLELKDREKLIGGYLLARNDEQHENLGGFALGTWNKENDSVIDNLSRTLIKGNDDKTLKQEYGMDGEYVLYKNITNDFNAKIIILNRDNAKFDAIVETIKKHKNPHMEIINTTSSGNGPWHVTIEASGHAFDFNNNIINSGIHKAIATWTDGDIDITEEIKSVYNFSHIYQQSGIYNVIINGYDKYYNCGTDAVKINLASGVASSGLPHIELTAVPREGIVPFTVDFHVDMSGVVGAYNLFWDFGNGFMYWDNASDHTIEYAIPGDFSPYVKIRDNCNINVTDTLRIGYNK